MLEWLIFLLGGLDGGGIKLNLTGVNLVFCRKEVNVGLSVGI